MRAFELGTTDERTHVTPPVDHRPERQPFDGLHERLGELTFASCGNENAFGADAQLPGVRERTSHGDIHGNVKLRVRKHNARVLAAEFERTPDQPLTCASRNLSADAG